MKRSVWIWELFGFGVTSLLGTLLHFLYEFSGKSLWVAPFSSVNESTWEHMKLLFWPMLLYAVIQSFFFSGYVDFWCIKLRGIVVGLSLIPIIFYLYNGIIGKSPDWFNIAIFFISAAVAYIYETKLFKKKERICGAGTLSVLLILAIATLFVLFTFVTPEINIFKDPITNSFGA